ncbi:MAG: RidA family protein [Pseudomonadota bacterium]
MRTGSHAVKTASGNLGEPVMSINKDVRRFGVPWEDYPYVQANRVGNILYLSGQIAHDENGDLVGIGDMAAQMRAAYANIARLLKEYYTDFDHIVDEMMFVTDMEAALECASDVRREAYGGDSVVTSTLLKVAGLAFPELLVEIKCVVHLAE